MKRITAEELEQQTESTLDHATREPVTVTRKDNKPAIVMVSKTIFDSMIDELSGFIR